MGAQHILITLALDTTTDESSGTRCIQ